MSGVGRNFPKGIERCADKRIKHDDNNNERSIGMTYKQRVINWFHKLTQVKGVQYFNVNDIEKLGKPTTYKEKLIHYMVEKNRILYKLTGIYLMNERDFREVYFDWTEKRCKSVLIDMKDSHYKDEHICPWCQISTGCHRCSYGKRHIYCADGSEYQSILHALYAQNKSRRALVLLPEIQKLLEEVCNDL
jgi:hypothetical protein